MRFRDLPPEELRLRLIGAIILFTLSMVILFTLSGQR